MQYGNAYDFACDRVLNGALIALFPADGCLPYVTWGTPRAGHVVHRYAYSDDARKRALCAVALVKVARGIHAEVGA